MPYIVRSTPIAERQISGLRGARRKAYDLFEEALARRGCAALGYRLTGDEPLPSLCVKHLRGSDRAVVTFSDHEAWVLLVGPHVEGEAAYDIYTALYALAGVPGPTQPRNKPPCCDEHQVPPTLDQAVIDDLVKRGRALRH